MGIQWLKQITGILTDAGIRAGEAFPGGGNVSLTEAVAAVGLRDLNWREGTAEFEIRVLSPRPLGGWKCQNCAADAVAALEEAGVVCRMEPMEYRGGSDCFEMIIIGQQQVMEVEAEVVAPVYLDVSVGDTAVEYVTEFSAEQNRQRRIIGSVSQNTPVGITPGTGGWGIRLVQELPGGQVAMTEPEEPFVLTVKEEGMTTTFVGCGWNRVKKKQDQSRTLVEWEGFALSREENANG